MKKIIYIAFLFLIFACNQNPPPYWKTDSFGLISSLNEGDTLVIKGGDYFDINFDHLRFFIKKDSLYTMYELSNTYYNRKLQRKDTLITWKNNPLNISNNKLVLDCYRTFEKEFKAWKDTLDICAPYSKYSIYFNNDTLSIVDRSCRFNSQMALTFFVQESTKLSDAYSITPEQATNIKYGQYE